MLKKELGKNIQLLRKQKKITQEKLAEAIGIDPKNISKIENGNNYPSAETLTSIIKVLNVEPYELFLFNNNIPYKEMRSEIIKALDQEKNILLLYKALKNLSI